MEPEELRNRIEVFVTDLEARTSKQDGAASQQVEAMASEFLSQAKAAAPDDPILATVSLPDHPKYSDLVPLMRQVALALPRFIGIG